MKKILIIFLAFLVFFRALSQNIDVLHYTFRIELNDNNDTIKGQAEIKLRFLAPVSEIALDFTGVQPDGKGMKTGKVEGPGVRGHLTQGEKIRITLSPANRNGDTTTYIINYSGIPSDGLIISKNKYGKRTFFSDNWPNRAHHWLPCVDHPDDKAGIEFIVIAPQHYQVVSNGIQVEETNLPGNKKLTHWKEEVPLPPKIMVIGVAEFAMQYVGDAAGIPVYSWVYPENRTEGFYDYGQALEILPFFVDYIGPYGYKKLANIQSKTRFGGMENASAIFYSESSVTGKRTIEGLLAHEIAHQWFGNMASEKNFSHVWLSEGFATYFTNLFMENKYGKEKMDELLKEQRKQVISFSKRNTNAVIDTSSDYMELLNANSYQKGAWILHMLRNDVGDDNFRKLIRSYYDRFAGKNADSEDFKKVAEEVSGKNLDSFFRQWLYVPGQPQLQLTWNYNNKNKELTLNLLQKQKEVFSFPLEISFELPSGDKKNERIFINTGTKKITIPMKGKPVAVNPDPRTRLLAELIVTEGK